MAISDCGGPIADNKQELLAHGTTAFPVGCYYDDLAIEPVNWHWHEELEAVVVTEGATLVCLEDGQRHELQAGDGFFINTGILHGCWNLGKSHCRYHSLTFHARLIGGSPESVIWQKYVSPILSDASLHGIIFRNDTPWMAEALTHIENTWQACAAEPAGFELQAREELGRLLFLIGQHSKQCQMQPDGRSLRNAGRIRQMLELVHNRYSDPLTIQEIADSASISKSACLRCFKETLGISPIQYVKEYRLQKAADAIRAGAASISDIAIACGFMDMSYFSRSFREQFGCSPSQYKEKATLRYSDGSPADLQSR